MRLAVVLALVGAVAVAGGVGLAYMPAGVVVGGLEMLAAAYAIAYLKARARREAA